MITPQRPAAKRDGRHPNKGRAAFPHFARQRVGREIIV
jgi:hypothetical protein